MVVVVFEHSLSIHLSLVILELSSRVGISWIGLQDGFLLAYNENGNVWIDMHFELVSDPRWLSQIPPCNRGLPEWMEDEMNSHVGVVRCMLSDDIVWSSSLDSVEVRGSVVVMTLHDSCLVALIHEDEDDYYPTISPVRLVHSVSVCFLPLSIGIQPELF